MGKILATIEVNKVIRVAKSNAKNLGQTAITPELLLNSMLKGDDCVGKRLLSQLGVQQQNLPQGDDNKAEGSIDLSQESKLVIAIALNYAHKHNLPVLDTGTMLIGLIKGLRLNCNRDQFSLLLAQVRSEYQESAPELSGSKK